MTNPTQGQRMVKSQTLGGKNNLQETVLIIGFGEIGKPMYELAKGIYPQVDWLDIDNRKVSIHPSVVHICYPEADPKKFIQASTSYLEKFKPRLALIESTVSPGTTNAIHEAIGKQTLVCHSPVRGNMTEGMKRGLLQYTKYIGPTSSEAGRQAKEYYESLGLRTSVMRSPAETELGKIFETTYRGLMMAWFQEINRMCEHFDASFDQVVDFVGSTGKEGKQARPIFHPGVIGGHCIIPNAEKLDSLYPSAFVEALLESNKKRAKELTNPGGAKEMSTA